eukprot:scaffold28661_cov68-Attheya_sp.AAC.3
MNINIVVTRKCYYPRNPVITQGTHTKDDNGYDEDDIKGNDDIQATSTEKNKKVMPMTKNESKTKCAKHVYVPRVWFEGKKMIIRGKADLKQSNEAINYTLKEKEKAKRYHKHKENTDNDVRSGTQTTLANFGTVKQSKSVNSSSAKSKPSKTTQYTVEHEHTFKGGNQEESSIEDCKDYIYLQQECEKPMIKDWSGMELDPYYIPSMEKK